MIFSIYSNGARLRKRRRANEALNFAYVQDQVQVRNGSKMFWRRVFFYYQLQPFTEVTTNMKQHIYFDILDDSGICICKMSVLLLPLLFTTIIAKILGLQEYLTGLMSTHIPFHIWIGLRNHLILTVQKIYGTCWNSG